jgi:hypothetical protein
MSLPWLGTSASLFPMFQTPGFATGARRIRLPQARRRAFGAMETDRLRRGLASSSIPVLGGVILALRLAASAAGFRGSLGTTHAGYRPPPSDRLRTGSVDTTLAPILISFSRSVFKDQCFTLGGRANRRRKLPRLYARANSCSRTWLSAKSWHDSLVCSTSATFAQG